MSERAVVTVDLSDLPCPTPLLGAKKILEVLEQGQTLRLLSNCPGVHDDLAAWCRHTGHVLVSATTQSGAQVAYILCRSKREHTYPRPHLTLDMRGVACPGPILEAKKLLMAMASGEVLRLTTDCTAAIDDVPLWIRHAEIEFLLQVELPNGAQEFLLRKR